MKTPAFPHRAPQIGKDNDSFDFSLWMEAVEAKSVAREKLRQRVLRDLDHCLDKLVPKFRWRSLYLFGSIVKPQRFTETSDIDLAVQGIDKYRYFEFVGAMQSAMSRPVDVIMLEECNFCDSILKSGVRWKPKAA